MNLVVIHRSNKNNDNNNSFPRPGNTGLMSSRG